MNLIGRTAALDRVRSCLATGRNLVVAGPEGAGKTALVLEAVRGRPGILYCADTSTLKTACECLLVALGIAGAPADNVARKRMVLRAVRGRKTRFVFDHVGRVTPRLLSLLEAIHESHPLIIVTRSLAWPDIGHLKMILWDFDKLEIANLGAPDARRLVRAESERLGLRLPDARRFEREVCRLSHGNPRLILELCRRADAAGPGLSARVLDLDRRIAALGLP